MKADIHPEYKSVVMKDQSTDYAILTRTTMKTSGETIKWEDGNEYPLIYLDISSASHPFYTGKQQFVDTLGRVEKFRKKFAGKYGKGKKEAEAAASESTEAAE